MVSDTKNDPTALTANLASTAVTTTVIGPHTITTSLSSTGFSIPPSSPPLHTTIAPSSSYMTSSSSSSLLHPFSNEISMDTIHLIHKLSQHPYTFDFQTIMSLLPLSTTNTLPATHTSAAAATTTTGGGAAQNRTAAQTLAAAAASNLPAALTLGAAAASLHPLSLQAASPHRLSPPPSLGGTTISSPPLPYFRQDLAPPSSHRPELAAYHPQPPPYSPQPPPFSSLLPNPAPPSSLLRLHLLFLSHLPQTCVQFYRYPPVLFNPL